MAPVSICLMFSLSRCDRLTVKVDDPKTCLHSARGQAGDVKKKKDLSSKQAMVDCANQRGHENSEFLTSGDHPKLTLTASETIYKTITVLPIEYSVGHFKEEGQIAIEISDLNGDLTF